MIAKHASVRLWARQALSFLGISAALLVSAGTASANPSATIYVSPTGSDSNSGSQASPFLTINAAITAASNGDTIDIADGTYTGAGNVDLDTAGKSLTIQSDHGAASTIIDCGGTSSTNHRGFHIVRGEAVSVIGLTVKNGYENNDHGGGLYISDSNVTLANCVVSGNTTSYGGGGVFNVNSTSVTITLTNCLISGNSANYGGGIYSESDNFSSAPINSATTFTNCTLTGNTASSGSSGIESNSNNLSRATGNNITTTFTNCILYGDANREISDYNRVGTLTVSDSDVQGGSPGTGNINADPQFVSASDFHLLPGSPALGAGTASGAPATDIIGTTRPNPPSMGAYEVGVAPITLTSITVTPATPSVTVGSTQQFIATAAYSDNTTADVTAQATWTSDNTAAATIDSHGLATGVAVGTSNINAVLNGYQSTTGVLTVTAVPVPVVTGYQALWSHSGGSFSIWEVALGGGYAPHDFDALPGFTAQALADTPDGHVHVLLAASSGAVTLEDADVTTLTRSHNSAVQTNYGPFPNWTAKAIAAGPDGVLYLLWARTDGMLSLWKMHSDGTYDHAEYGPYAGWTPRFFSVAHDNTLRVLWTNASGQMSFWVVDAQGGFQNTEFGPYPGWTPTALATSSSGMNLLSWTHTGDGMLSLWALRDNGQFAFANFGPFADWTAGSLAVGADNTLHVGWSQPTGAASLWDLSRSGFQFSVYGPYSAWHLQGLAAAP